MTLQDFLSDLQSETKPLKYSGLSQISGLSTEEATAFKAAWESVPGSRKQEIVNKLVELSDDNIELDFTQVFKLCLKDTESCVREKATHGLWECGDRTIIHPLINLLLSDPSAKVRAAASDTLSSFTVMTQNDKLISQDADRIQEALITVIRDKDEEVEVKRRAIETISAFDLPKVDQIIRNAYRSNNLRMMQSSIYAMGRSGKNQWLRDIIKNVGHEDASIRYEAVLACGQLGDDSNVPDLIPLLKDEDYQVQLAAIKSLGEIGGQLAQRELIQSLETGDESLTEIIGHALAQIDFDEDPLGFQV